MKSKPKRGKWIVKLEKLTKCFKCSSYFITSKDYNEHIKSHLDETEIKVEEEQDVRDELQNSVSSSGETKKKIESQSNHFQSQRGKMKDVEYKEINNENGVKKFQCIRCEKIFKTLQSVVQHIYLLHREKKLKCEKCYKMFAFKSILQIHLKKCDGKFRVRNPHGVTVRSRNYNILISDQVYKFQCKNCHEIFSDRTAFYIHFRIHMEMKFTCDNCSKNFIFKSMLETHKKKCDGILKERETNAKKYKIVTSKDGQEFQCLKCPEIYSEMAEIQKHIRKHQDKKHRCDLCGKMIWSRNISENHIKKCDGILKERRIKVKKIGLREKNYKIIISEDGKKFQCLKCPVIFSERLKFHSHKRIHQEKIKNHKCHQCSKTFWRKTNLENHSQTCDGTLKQSQNVPWGIRSRDLLITGWSGVFSGLNNDYFWSLFFQKDEFWL